MKSTLRNILLAAAFSSAVCGVSAQGGRGAGGNGGFGAGQSGRQQQTQQRQRQQENIQEEEEQARDNKPSRQAPVAAPATAQPVSAADTIKSFSGKVLERFKELYRRGVDEKLYLQFDKPYYAAGDTMWFKGYLVNAITTAPMLKSQYIYVELADSKGALLGRSKIKAEGDGFANSLYLKPDMPAGDYTVRAYTQWMENNSNDYFFTRIFRIGNPIDERFSANVSYDKQADGKVLAKVTIYGGSGPLVKADIDLTLDSGGKTVTSVAQTDDNGAITVPFTPSAGRGLLTVSMDKGAEKPCTASFRLPDYTNDFDVQFMPEGGALLGGVMQKVAFKATGVNGLSVKVSGEIYNSRNEVVSNLTTFHNGMGVTSLVAEAGEKYHAVARSDDGVEKRFELPAVRTEGYALKITPVRGRFICEVLAAPGAPAGDMAVVVHNHGRVVMAETYSPGTPKAIEMDKLSPGVIHFTLVDKNLMEPVSQRLAFVPENGKFTASVTADKLSYGKREKVTLKIDFTRMGQPVAGGTFGVSVTDAAAVKWDSLAGNIASSLLLTSDIKGYVENPGEYFADQSPVTLAKIDLLLMTQGWTRFEMSDLLKGRLKKYEREYEESQVISGRIEGFFGGEAKDASLLLVAPKIKYFDQFKLGQSSRFIIDGLSFPDSVVFSVQAQSKSGGKRAVALELNPELFPETMAYIPPLRPSEAAFRLPDAFLNNSKQRYYYEGGMRVLDLDAVQVTGRRKVELVNGIEVEPTRSATEKDMEEKYPGMTAREIIAELYPRSVNTQCRVWIDDFPVTDITPEEAAEGAVGDLDRIAAEQIESIYVVADVEAAALLDGDMGIAVVITLRRGGRNNRVDLPSMVTFRPLGFKKPTQFYQPRYDVASVARDSKPDARTTLLWDPAVVAGPDGTATVWFYTADNATVYDVILEGVSASGDVCRASVSVQRK